MPAVGWLLVFIWSSWSGRGGVRRGAVMVGGVGRRGRGVFCGGVWGGSFVPPPVPAVLLDERRPRMPGVRPPG